MIIKFALALMLATTPVATIAVKKNDKALELAKVAFMKSDLESLAGRTKLVSAVREYCSEIERVYPQNSPAEEQWLRNELRGGGDRFIRALASAEWGRSEAKLFTDQCGKWSAAFEGEPDRPRYYVGLAYEFMRFDGDAENFARMNNIDPEEFNFGVTLSSTSEALVLAALSAENGNGL